MRSSTVVSVGDFVDSFISEDSAGTGRDDDDDGDGDDVMDDGEEIFATIERGVESARKAGAEGGESIVLCRESIGESESGIGSWKLKTELE